MSVISEVNACLNYRKLFSFLKKNKAIQGIFLNLQKISFNYLIAEGPCTYQTQSATMGDSKSQRGSGH